MKKKILFFIMILALILSLAACKGEEKDYELKVKDTQYEWGSVQIMGSRGIHSFDDVKQCIYENDNVQVRVAYEPLFWDLSGLTCKVNGKSLEKHDASDQYNNVYAFDFICTEDIVSVEFNGYKRKEYSVTLPNQDTLNAKNIEKVEIVRYLRNPNTSLTVVDYIDYKGQAQTDYIKDTPLYYGDKVLLEVTPKAGYRLAKRYDEDNWCIKFKSGANEGYLKYSDYYDSSITKFYGNTGTNSRYLVFAIQDDTIISFDSEKKAAYTESEYVPFDPNEPIFSKTEKRELLLVGKNNGTVSQMAYEQKEGYIEAALGKTKIYLYNVFIENGKLYYNDSYLKTVKAEIVPDDKIDYHTVSMIRIIDNNYILDESTVRQPLADAMNEYILGSHGGIQYCNLCLDGNQSQTGVDGGVLFLKQEDYNPEQ